MPRLFRFPFRFGSVPAAVPSVVTEEAPAGRWASVTGALQLWNAVGSATRRFEHIYDSGGRSRWNGGFVTEAEAGNFAYQINDEFPFRFDDVATFDSNISTP